MLQRGKRNASLFVVSFVLGTVTFHIFHHSLGSLLVKKYDTLLSIDRLGSRDHDTIANKSLLEINERNMHNKIVSKASISTSLNFCHFSDNNGDNYTINENIRHSLSISKLRICSLPTPPEGQKKVANKDLDQKIGFTPVYQCAGRPYQEYMLDHQLPFVFNKTFGENSAWGQRPSILPVANQNILIIGNSHARQMGVSLLCMYKEEVLSFEQLPCRERALKYLLKNNNSISFITNPSFIYSSKWKKNLEEFALRKPLEKFDAIVLGSFNRYNPALKSTQLWTRVLNFAYEKKELQIDLDSSGDPNLWLEEWLNVYSGPIIFTGMSAKYRAKEMENVKVLFQNHTKNGRNNLRTIDARKYIQVLNGVECSTTPSGEITSCIQDKDDDVYSNGHRCMGCLGGSPDMTAWDVVESLWDVL